MGGKDAGVVNRSISPNRDYPTFELKNSLSKQTVDDAVRQYQEDRSPREKLFELGRCVAHFAVDESEVLSRSSLTDILEN